MRTPTRWSALFITPPMLLFAAVVVVPTVMALRLSLTDAGLLSGAREFIGLENFTEGLRDEHVRKSVRITLIWTVLGAFVPLALGLGVATALQSNRRIDRMMKSALFVPIAISLVVVGQVWVWIYQPGDGLLNRLLDVVGLDGLQDAWLANRRTALFAVFIAWAWQQTALAMILYLAGLTSIPGELVEAAQVDGANRVQVFWRVIVPLLRPITTVVLSLIAINSLRNFDLVFSMTGGGPVRETETMPMLVYRILFRQQDQGMASAVSVMLFAMTLVIIGALTWWGRRRSHVA